jgi:hypothetical protein
MFESHHLSRHFEKRCRQTRHPPRKPRTHIRTIRARRRLARLVRSLPKLSLAVQAASHLILAARATTGCASDHPHFVPLLTQASARMPLRTVAADAGYDSQANHQYAREVLNLRSLIPPTVGSPTLRPLKGCYRQLMRYRLGSAGPDLPLYGQRWQAETVNSMLKRNLGSACRAKSANGRKKDMALRVITHNLMILTNL